MPSFSWDEFDVGLTEDDEEIAFAGVLEILGHVEVCVHAGLEHGDAAQITKLRRMRLIVEGAGDQHIESGIARLASRSDEVGALNGAELGADEDSGTLLSRRLRGIGLRRTPVDLARR